MKKIFLFCILIFSVISCKKNIKEPVTQKNEYATNFSVEIKNNQTEIFSAGEKVILPLDFKMERCIVTGTSASAYIDALGKTNTLIGVCSPEYFYNPEILKRIEDHSIENIGNDAVLNFEKIISLKPDVIITAHNTSYEKTLTQLAGQGIKIIYVEEYLELHPLGKTEYLKLFGTLYQENSRADSLYTDIKNRYLSLKQKIEGVKEKPRVFTNIMYGDAWYMAGGKSFIAALFSDAGADYIWKDNKDTGSIALSFEEVFSKAKDADYWIGASNFTSKREMLSSNSHYEWFAAYKNDRIYTMNQRENKQKANDYYESGSIYADKTLSDVIKILYPELLPDYQLTYLKKLN